MQLRRVISDVNKGYTPISCKLCALDLIKPSTGCTTPTFALNISIHVCTTEGGGEEVGSRYVTTERVHDFCSQSI